MTRAWWTWLRVCACLLVGVFLIALGTALHSPHYDTHSVEMAVLITLGIEALLTTIGVFFGELA